MWEGERMREKGNERRSRLFQSERERENIIKHVIMPQNDSCLFKLLIK